MKSLIEFPEEVATPSSSPSLLEKAGQQSYFDAIGFANSDCETDRSTSSTSTDIESDSGSDIDENDIPCDEHSSDFKNSAADNAVDESNNNKTTPRRSVSFGPIHVRQYERIVGDHPETKVGVPLAIGWAYYEDERHPDGISIDRYESDRIQRGKLRMSSITRKNMMLHVFGLDEEEIRMAEKRSTKLRKQNAKSVGGSQSPLKKFGKKIKKGGMTVLKGLSQAAQFGSGAGLVAVVDHTF